MEKEVVYIIIIKNKYSLHPFLLEIFLEYINSVLEVLVRKTHNLIYIYKDKVVVGI